jgi:hypothetical protein
MADNTLQDRELSKAVVPADEKVDLDRRIFFGRAALAALPVVLATVRGRTVFAAGTASCPASANISSCTAH